VCVVCIQSEDTFILKQEMAVGQASLDKLSRLKKDCDLIISKRGRQPSPVSAETAR